jgi:hypothetical protein
LTWDPNVEPNVAGYSVYWGIESGIYPQSVDVGSQTDYTIYSLEEGQTYYFSVTAYKGTGTESDYASEVYVTLNTQMSSCAGDIDQDGIVDGQDMAAFSTAFESSIGELNYDPAADFDSDGAIAIPDLEVISVAFGRTDCN